MFKIYFISFNLYFYNVKQCCSKQRVHPLGTAGDGMRNVISQFAITVVCGQCVGLELFYDYLAQLWTNIKASGQRYTQTLPDSIFFFIRANTWYLSSIASRVRTRAFQVVRIRVTILLPNPLRTNQSYRVKCVQISSSLVALKEEAVHAPLTPGTSLALSQVCRLMVFVFTRKNIS